MAVVAVTVVAFWNLSRHVLPPCRHEVVTMKFLDSDLAQSSFAANTFYHASCRWTLVLLSSSYTSMLNGTLVA